MTNLIIFGSESDKRIYDEIKKNLKNSEVKIASAHRDPELVEEILKQDYDVIIAGAGLAAHLPGVVASKTLRPVIGVPVGANFLGLDSLLSIIQMPKGVPVLCVGVNNAMEAARNAKKLNEQYEFVTIIGKGDKSAICAELLEKFGVNYEYSDKPNETAININFTQLSNPHIIDTEALVINVPLSKMQTGEDALKLLELTQKGLWLGLNRGENAAIVALQIMNLDRRYEEKLTLLREGMKQKKNKEESVTYKSAGVDIDKGNESINLIKELVKQTYDHNTISEIGLFGGFYRFNKNQYENPVLVSSTDGVGTKLKLAVLGAKYDTVGTDLVNHCVNDILVHGATPMFFLDYIGVGKLKPKIIEEIVKGFSLGCIANNTVLIGGETAEMPGIYKEKDFNIAGTIIGVVEKDRIIKGDKIVSGDIVIGLPSSGLHTNGYSLAIKILIENCGYTFDKKIKELGMSVGDALLRTHTSYLKPIKALIKKFNIQGMAHITGGGIPGNLNRILPKNCNAEIDKDSWKIPPLFKFIQDKGNVPEEDMYRTFNMGIGYVIVIAKTHEKEILRRLEELDVKGIKIGSIVEGEGNVRLIQSGFFKKLFKKKENNNVNGTNETINRTDVETDNETDNENKENDSETIKKHVKEKEIILKTLKETDFKELGEKYTGKVRDVYTKDNQMIIITTDRVSAFDKVIGEIPLKGQVLNQIAQFWFEKTKDIIQNHIIEVPDPNVSIVKKCVAVPVEIIVRQYLTGSLWRDYQNGKRDMYGLNFPDGLQKYHKFITPILTPTTKEKDGHDAPISREKIILEGVIPEEQLRKIEDTALKLFRRGTDVSEKRGLVLVDTKYEFGIDDNGNIVLIDEIHTPDSSRFWLIESLHNISIGQEPKELNKEFLRQWLLEKGFSGEGISPELTPEIIEDVKKRYIELYEKITGKTFISEQKSPISVRIEKNLKSRGYL